MFNCVLTYLVTQTAKQLQCKFQYVLFVVFEAMMLTVCSQKSPAKLNVAANVVCLLSRLTGSCTQKRVIKC